MAGKKDPQELWDEYAASKSQEARNALINHYFYLVRIKANIVARRIDYFYSPQELWADGVLGLIRAIEIFDPSRGLKFVTIAGTKIWGFIMDALRKLDHVPRRARLTQIEMDKIQSKLEQELGRKPLSHEYAEELGITIDEYLQTANRERIRDKVSLDAKIKGSPEDQEDLFIKDTIESRERDRVETLDFFETVSKNLSVKERATLYLYYLNGFSFKEAGEFLGFTESRACQHHRSARNKLRECLVV